jgi:hypothetical protein
LISVLAGAFEKLRERRDTVVSRRGKEVLAEKRRGGLVRGGSRTRGRAIRGSGAV